MENIANEMIMFRAKHNLSQKELADLSNVDRVTVVNAEKGRRLHALTEAKIRLAMQEVEAKE